MPAEHRFRFDDLQRVPNIGSQRVYPGKHQPVDAGEGQTARGLAVEHIQLVPEHQDFGFQLGPRPEEPSESAPDQLAKVDHRPRASNRFAQAYQPDWVSGRDRLAEAEERALLG